MPELPEVEAVTRNLRSMALGAVITGGGVYRPGVVHPQTPRRVLGGVRGRRIDACERRGKNILVHLDNGHFLRIHLRMTGNVAVLPDFRLRPATARWWLEFEDGRGMILDDPRALGRVTLHAPAEMEALFADLGPEPFSDAFTERHFLEAARRTPKPAKIFLMDQKAVVGLGNIYAAEALFQARVNPARPVRDVSAVKLKALYRAIVEVLGVAVDSAITAYTRPGGFEEGELFPVAVYGREGEPCPACGTRVRRMPQGGRSTYYCPHCQK